MDKPIPKKLKDDAIVESLLEVRFSSSDLAESFIGRVIDKLGWNSAKLKRLPVSDIPENVRRASADLRFQPTVELIDSGYVLRIGPNVVSFHAVERYPGWEKFESRLKDLAQTLFACIKGLEISRLGLRYINALSPLRHKIKSLSDLDVKMSISGSDIKSWNLNYRLTPRATGMEAMVRISDTSFVSGKLPEKVSAIVDVDVYSTDVASLSNVEDVLNWIAMAHKYEKEAFFSVLTKSDIEQMMVE